MRLQSLGAPLLSEVSGMDSVFALITLIVSSSPLFDAAFAQTVPIKRTAGSIVVCRFILKTTFLAPTVWTATSESDRCKEPRLVYLKACMRPTGDTCSLTAKFSAVWRLRSDPIRMTPLVPASTGQILA